MTLGRPTDDELAAVVAVLMSVLSAAPNTRPAGPPVRADGPRPGWIGKPSYRPPGAWAAAPHTGPSVVAEG